MFHRDYVSGLELACEIHKKYTEQIDVTLKDRKLAIYYLQGGSLTSAFTALKNWKHGDLNGVYRAQRFIAETNEQLLFLSTEVNAERHINNFFKGNMMDLRNVKRNPQMEKDLEETVKKKTGKDFSLHSNKRILQEEFSKGVHPTLSSSAYNSDRVTGEFDYEVQSKEFEYYPIKNFDFGNFIVIPAMQSIYVYHHAFSVDSDLISKAETSAEHIQSLSIQMHKAKRAADII